MANQFLLPDHCRTTDYVIPAARVDIEREGDSGSQRTIEVATAQLSWDELVPGIYLGPGGTPAAEAPAPSFGFCRTG